MRIAKVLLLLLLSVACGAHAECAAQRSDAHPHLVELYTSEGCSSCPPADDWVRSLPADRSVISLAYHVDYWDYLGWRDRFADPHYSQRQHAQAGRDGGSGVYTPQIVLDGHSWSGWYRANAQSALAKPSGGNVAGMRMSAAAAKPELPGTPLRLRIDTTFANPADATGYRNYVALSEDGLSSQVRAGENRGALLRHDHVVRAFAGPLPLANAETEIALPSDIEITHASFVAFAQRASDGAIAQVVALPLAQCR